ncbi:MAG: DUF695 domain-containing protein [Firmicutes bacterium]|nr:DUF695 domain-containing protein [Bacillota bacterium]MCM1401099.1 DUF695 domain-containing protein [Bacteroides sp.]MCM1477078.1 DUF695 domain-containing protein [Bacteroides sp.]
MENSGQWWTSPQESENGNLVLVTGRKDVDKFRNNKKFSIRVEVTWNYEPLPDGMPDLPTSQMFEKVTDALLDAFRKDPVAVMTGIFTGDGQRNWIFYTLSTNIFGKKLNEALKELPTLPLEIYCENDPEWAEYMEMAEAEIHADD